MLKSHRKIIVSVVILIGKDTTQQIHSLLVQFEIFHSALLGISLAQKPWEPTPKMEKWWLARHRDNLRTTAALGKEIKIVFIGSSSIEYWSTTASEIWETKYVPLGAVNYGIRSDRTEHVLWRIENGEFDGLSPKLVVIYIGSNNVPLFTEEECVRGVNAVIDKLHEKLPNTNLLFVGFFPRGDRRPVTDMLGKIRNVTDTVKPMIDGDESKNSHFIDLFWSYAPDSMENIYEEFYCEDKLHQNFLGYQLWDNLLNSTFFSLLE